MFFNTALIISSKFDAFSTICMTPKPSQSPKAPPSCEKSSVIDRGAKNDSFIETAESKVRSIVE